MTDSREAADAEAYRQGRAITDASMPSLRAVRAAALTGATVTTDDLQQVLALLDLIASGAALMHTRVCSALGLPEDSGPNAMIDRALDLRRAAGQ
jgi:hypothetical protein